MKLPAIEFDHVTFQYFAQKYPTLKDISFTIYKGEKVLVIGHSGSGKSTIGNLLNGLIPFSYSGEQTGTVRFFEQEVTEKNIFDRSKTIGTVLQDSDAQFVGLSVGEDIAFSLENQNTPLNEMKNRVLQEANRVDMDSFLTQSPHNISGGQKQRTALAGILVDDVDILLFDEPLANLDPKTGKIAIEMIDQIQKEQDKTVIIIEHRIEDVLHRPIDRILLIDNGTLIANLTTNELLKSDFLQNHGLREPLYVALLRLANHSLKNTRLEHIQSLEGIDYSLLKDWFTTVQVPKMKRKDTCVLSTENLSFSYSKREVLKDINFKVYEGEMISLVGENGAGKSTLSKLICGFEQGYTGEITIHGISMKGVGIYERAKHVGFVMQNPNLMITKQTVFEEIALGLVLQGKTEEEIQTEVDKVIDICGLTRQKTWPISALSYGQKKRVTIAAILIMNPSILILDEPTAGQDYKHYTEIMEFLKSLNEKGYTIILVTHDMHLMLEYTTRSLVLKKGKLLRDTTSSEVLTDLALVDEASLKETSLYYMAERMGVSPKQLVDSFIYKEKAVRSNG